MNIHAWIEYTYYDGLLTFSQLHVTCEDSRITYWSVNWLNSSAGSGAS